MVALHESFCIVLAAFEHGALAAWTDDEDMAQAGLLGEVVGDARHKRCLGTYHHHFDTVRDDKALHGGKVVGVESHVFTHCRSACVAGGNEELTALFALRNLVSDSVFATAGTQK